MIIINIKNGLGNQLFQYAFGKVLEWKYNSKVYFDLLREETESSLQSELNVFSIEPIIEAKPLNRNKYMPFSVREFRDKKQYIKYIYFKIRRIYQRNKLITEPYPSQFMLVFNNIELQKDYYFLGFWQNPKYFIGYEDKIRGLFQPKDKSVLESKIALEISNSTKDTVSLHFRRGDYLTSGFIEPASMDYYTKAIEFVSSKVINPFFYIFTDEPEWVQNNFVIKYPFKVITGNNGQNAYIDILLMSKCKSHIIANSSFSWWGAWLDSNPNKIVIAPKKWYANAERDKFTSEITPYEWIRL
jgi:hypothetical protein